MLKFSTEYIGVFAFLIVGLALGLVLILLPQFLGGDRTQDPDKLTAYECGFDPFDDCRAEFSIHFYLLAILFIIFDLEVVLLLPWAVYAGSLNEFSVWIAIDFLIELGLGFGYVWLAGALSVNPSDHEGLK